jgi:hypothetical protein
MLFGFSIEDCSKRMDVLCNAGLVTRLFLPTTEDEKPEPIFTLTRTGAMGLARLRHLDAKNYFTSFSKPSYYLMEHSLKISLFLTTLISALRDTSLKLSRWQSEYSIRSSRRKSGEKIPVIPDGLFALEDNGVFDSLFVEADRGTMGPLSIQKKMLGYIQLFRRNMHRQFFGIPHFRVLFITTTPYRRDQARAALRELHYCPNMVLFALWKDIKPQTIKQAIWLKCNSATTYSIIE